MILTEEHILNLLKNISDPEIPVLNIVEMGIVREVLVIDRMIEIKITPTYSGCPAMKTIEEEIKDVLIAEGIENITVTKIYSPPWTTDWMNEETKLKLKEYGIAPPDSNAGDDDIFSFRLKKITCPYCSSDNTKLTSEFGSTACKSMHYCDNCRQPFEHFKCI